MHEDNSKYNILNFKPSSEFKIPNVDSPLQGPKKDDSKEEEGSGLVSILYNSIYDIVMIISYLLDNLLSFIWMLSRIVWSVSMTIYRWTRKIIEAFVYVVMHVIDFIGCAITSITLGG